MIMDARKKKINNKGQAIFEMLVFFPFIVLLFTLIVTVGNSINGSINQQKATRSYFYYSVANDSMGAPIFDMGKFAENGVESSGMYSFGWKESQKGETPLAGCYKLNKLLGNGNNDTCFEAEVSEGTTSFIRVFTAYGLCTGVQRTDDGGSTFYLNRQSGGSYETCVNF